jgi:hypothetical protein
LLLHAAPNTNCRTWLLPGHNYVAHAFA